jgi:hypothetical protein
MKKRTDDMRPRHAVVLRALERANTTHGRMALVEEIAAAMQDDERALMSKAYIQPFNYAVAKVLSLLLARGLVFSNHQGWRRCYGSVKVLDSASAPLPTIMMARRQRVLQLVHEAVGKPGRAVRAVDVITHAAEKEETQDIPIKHIVHDLACLTQTGELRVLDKIRGDGSGLNLYLPVDASAELYLPKEPLTWLEEVAHSFRQMWEARAQQAAVEGGLPRPVATPEVRAFLEKRSAPLPKQMSPAAVTNALKQLAEANTAVIRKVTRQGEWANLWAPIDVPDERLEIHTTYANPNERIAVAVRRAVERLNRPVTTKEVDDELEVDADLRPPGDYNTARLLIEASKQSIGGSKSQSGAVRKNRVHRYVQRVGQFHGTAYYYPDGEGIDAARAYIEFRRIKAQWIKECASGQLDELESCTLPCLAAGRALLVLASAEHTSDELDRLLAETSLYSETRLGAETLLAELHRIMQRGREWLSARSLTGLKIPSRVSEHTPGWTAEDLLHAIVHLYPPAKTIDAAHKLVPLLDKNIRRIKNSDFTSRFSKESQQAAEYLFDRADALLFAAKQWGGYECCLQANLAGNEIGNLRDPQFIFPALDSKKADIRLTAVACLAFVQSVEGNDLLKQVAMKDVEPGIRQSALWAYGGWTKDIAGVMAQHDPSEDARKFAEEIAKAEGVGIWQL